MRTAHTILELLRQRGQQRLPLQRVYRLLYRPDLYLMAYGKIYRNKGAMTKGVTTETVDAMSLEKIRAIIDAVRHERYRWHPARRTYIPRKDGKQRPLGIQTWSDKLLQEVLRLILSAYFEPQFSEHSHGFRPGRGCHTALRDIHRNWVGATWFIEGDIAKCFDRLDRKILLARLRQYIQDERFLRLIHHLLKAGYLEAWTWHTTYSGAPQGSILSPLLSNLYLDALDSFVEHTLIPEYTRGIRRHFNPAYERLHHRASYLKRTGRLQEARQVRRQAQQLPSIVPDDPDYRRLRFCRYADDFLLGFVGPKQEAEAIKRRLSAFLQHDLTLELSETKTLITHARTEFAHFLGYDIHVFQKDSKHDRLHRRSVNGGIGLRVPRAVVDEHCRRYPHRRGKVLQRTELINDTEFSITWQTIGSSWILVLHPALQDEQEGKFGTDSPAKLSQEALSGTWCDQMSSTTAHRNGGFVMSDPMTTIDPRYSDPDTVATEWEDTRRALEMAELFWITTVRSDGRPHVTPLVAVWLDGALHFCTGATEQKAINLRSNSHVILMTGCNNWHEGLDVVVEGDAIQITDEALLQRLAGAWTSKWDGRWQFTVRDGAFEGGTTLVFQVTPTKILAFAKGHFSHTRHLF
jgi:group II intron reverse transcriptase/maturase